MNLNIEPETTNIKDTESYSDTTAIEIKSKELFDEISSTELYLNKVYSELSDDNIPDFSEEYINNKYLSFKRAAKDIRKSYKKILFLQDEFSTRFKDILKLKKKPKAIPSNTLIDIREKKANHFASGINPYKLQLICFFGCFAGVILEMLWCIVRWGKFESRAGLVYGPFNLLYGFGAVCMTVALYRLRNKSAVFSFAGGFIVGTAVEYICSLLQETLVGSVSWDYSSMPFNINGRVCLLYSVFWGVLGVLWMKVLYPWSSKLILKIPNKIGKPLSWIMSVFILLNAIITIIAVFRWSQRLDGISADNPFWAFIDARFTDSRMKSIFPNMVF